MRRIVGLSGVFAFTLIIGQSSVCGEPYGPRSFEGPGFTAVVAAYGPEIEAILDRIDTDPNAEITETLVFKGVTYRLGNYRGMPIVVFVTGISIANAAMTMQMAFDYFPIEEVVYMGIAGGINPALKPGDVVVPERWYYHDESVYVNPQPDGGGYILPDYYEAFLEDAAERRKTDPHVPAYAPFEFIFPDDVLIIKDGMDTPTSTAYFPATERLINLSKIAAVKLQRPVIGGRPAQISVGGNGVTGSVFLDNREYRKWAREVFKAEVTEMESAAVGQVCHINEVDWVIIRALSDLAGGQEGKNEENIYDALGSKVGTALMFGLLDELAAREGDPYAE